MQIPFYQTEWLGINLSKLIKEMSYPAHKVPDSKIYNELYKTIFQNNSFFLDLTWLERKRTLSAWLESYFEQHALKKAKMLSIGCGFGVIEAPLIKQGYNIELQECQEYSIEYFKRHYPEEFQKTKFILSNDLKNIQTSSYEVVLSITSTYCLDKEILDLFLTEVKSILKKGGIFIWYETALTMTDLMSYARPNSNR
jgi:2-polyprenyl-3-methyl-5-hydroxy-6-metoxy-1,4-benzoquinol methylase